MPALLQATKAPPEDKPVINKPLIAYFTTRIGHQPQRYMTFESGFTLLCSLLSARSYFQPNNPRSNFDRLAYNYLQRNVEEVVMGLVLEAPTTRTMHLARSEHVLAAIGKARERFWGSGVEAGELGEMEGRVWGEGGVVNEV